VLAGCCFLGVREGIRGLVERVRGTENLLVVVEVGRVVRNGVSGLMGLGYSCGFHRRGLSGFVRVLLVCGLEGVRGCRKVLKLDTRIYAECLDLGD
jgi:hypothetical protein